MKKIAPTLQTFFGGERNPFRHPVVDDALRAELRALLAVAMAARAAIRVDYEAPRPSRDTAAALIRGLNRVDRALARLDAVSGRKGGGR